MSQVLTQNNISLNSTASLIVPKQATTIVPPKWDAPYMFVRPSALDISHRKLERMQRIGEIRMYYLRNPVRFMEEVLGAVLFDAQKYCVASSWTPPNILWVCTRGYGKSTIVDLIIMVRGMLMNNYRSFIASGSAQQSITTFMTLERIANKSIESMTGLTDVFSHEVRVDTAGGTGFIKNPAGHYYWLYNGSYTRTLNSSIDKARGYRAEQVVFDECGFLSDEMMNVFGAFTVVDQNLKVGGAIDAQSIATLPRALPNQLFYISSASSADTSFYKKFRDFSKRMIAGDPNYFVADINCDVMLKPLMGGKVYPASLLSKTQIDAEMRTNPEKGAREYWCHFTREGGEGRIIKRAIIVRNSYTRPPMLANPDNKTEFAFFYDPARTRDNSVVLICKVYRDKHKGWMMDVVNVVNFADVSLRKRTPKTTQAQVADMKQLMLDYNGKAPDYENIKVIMMDGGAGGGGNRLPDFFWEDWHDKQGRVHAGIIDREYSKEYVRMYPNAKNIFRVVQPAMKSDMFESLIRVMEADLITFPEEYDNRGYLTVFDTDNKLMDSESDKIKQRLAKEDLSEEEYNRRYNEELEKINSMSARMYKLSGEEENALVQIDAMKTEIVNICRTKRESGKDIFKLPAHKDADNGVSEGTMHDDRAYVLAMAGYYLSELRRNDQIQVAKEKHSAAKSTKLDFLKARAPAKVTRFA